MLKSSFIFLLLIFQLVISLNSDLVYAASTTSSPAKEVHEAPAVALDGAIDNLNAEAVLNEQKEVAGLIKSSASTSSEAVATKLAAAANLSVANVASSEEKITVTDGKTTKTESDIPVILEAQKKDTTTSDTKSKLLISLFMIAALLAGGYLLIRKIRSQNKTRELMPQIKVLTQHHMGPKKSLAIIRVAGESILIGVTDHNISLIKTLSLLDEDIPESTPRNFSDVMPKNIFNESTDSAVKPKASVGNYTFATSKNAKNTEEDFSFVGIKDAVSERLKDMRTIG